MFLCGIKFRPRKVWLVYIYADVVLIVNCIMNSVILVLTAHAGGISYSWKRLLLAALLGGVYALSGIFPEMAVLYSIPGKLMMSVMLVLMAFGYRTVRTTLVLVGAFFIVSFILGGATLGWLYFIQIEAPQRAGNYLDVSWSNLVTGSVIAVMLVTLIARRLLGKMIRQKNFYQARIEYNGQNKEITGMLDTGNNLYSLLGHKPVVLLCWQSAIQLLGPQVADYLTSTSPEAWLSNLHKCQDANWLARVEVIPCQSVGGRNMLLGFRPDGISVRTEDGLAHTTEVLIGLYDGVFASDRHCEALLHPALITGVNITKEVSICALPGQ